MKAQKIKFNGVNYKGYIYLNDEKILISEDLKDVIVDWYMQEIESIFCETQSGTEDWNNMTEDQKKESKALVAKLTVDQLINQYSPAKAEIGIRRKFNIQY